MQYAYDMLNRAAATISMDAGHRYFLPDTASKPLYLWDAKTNRFHTVYDQLRRPIQREVLNASAVTIVYEKLIYGTDSTKNQNGKIVSLYDQSGLITSDLYDFKGNLLSSTCAFTADYKDDIDWSNPGAVPLNLQSYVTQATFDALNRVVTSTTPDTSVVAITYSESGLLSGVNAALRGGASQPFVLSITHDERLRRQRVTFANGALTSVSR